MHDQGRSCANKVSQEMNIPKQEAEEGVNLFFDMIKEAILRGEEIEIRGLGTSYSGSGPRGPAGTRGRGNPSRVPPKKVLYFKPSKLLKE